jgi:hypothetical protein
MSDITASSEIRYSIYMFYAIRGEIPLRLLEK